MDARRLVLIVLSALGLVAALPAAAGAQVQEVAPDVKDLTIKPAKFKASATGPVVVTKGGALVTFTLNGGAPVRFSVKREQAGHKQGGKCVAGKTKSPKKACKRTSDVPGFFRIPGIAGPNELRISGFWDKAALKPGAYRLVARAEGLAARSSFVRFSIIK
jgi:hypothetical protein